MNTERPLQTDGSIADFPVVELFAELFQEKLDGSLRLSGGDKKSIVYFKKGSPIFAVSNQRTARLFDIVLRRGIMTREEIVAIEDFTNDQVLAAHLRSKSLLSLDATDLLFAEIVRNILIDVLSWTDGKWEYLPLARARDGLDSQIDLSFEIRNYARNLRPEYILDRFRSFDETVTSVDDVPHPDLVTPQDAFLLSRLVQPTRLGDLIHLVPTGETETLIQVYNLWLTGSVARHDNRSAFGNDLLNKLRSVKVELKREAESIHSSLHKTESPDRSIAPDHVSETPDQAEVEAYTPPTLEEYLSRFDADKTYYDILDLEPDADEKAFRTAYFRLAKAFHPDHFHNADADTFKRVQDAFAALAKAHETLRSSENRELYDFKIRKEIASREERKKSGVTESISVQLEQAEQSFDRGFNLLMDGETEDAIPFLARAVHYSPNNARYRAYYGKALTSDERKRHQAEAEMQAALKLDPENATYRLMLAEFFINVNLLRRAEGELKRLLGIFPSNREAQTMLADVQQRLAA